MHYNHHYERYLAHLKSDYWRRQVRPAVFEQQDGICAVCHKAIKGSWDCHHRNYSYLFHEMDGLHTLWALHPWCHEEVHSNRWTWAELVERVNRLLK